MASLAPANAAPESVSPQHNLVQGFALSLLAAYVDTLGFIALFGLFTAHVTGNFILIGAALADPTKASVLLKFLAFPAFIAGVAAGHLLIALTVRHHGRALFWSLSLQLVLLAGFMVCGVLAGPIGDSVSTYAMAAGLLGAAGMGVHSAISRLLLGHLAPTSLMTGNVSQLVIELVNLLAGWGDLGSRARVAKFLWPIVGFAIGAVLAAFGYAWFGFFALTLPLLILLGLILMDSSKVPPT